MERRPSSLLGLTSRLINLKWHAASRGTKAALVAALILGGAVLGSSARCVLNSACGASSSCPYSADAAADVPPCH